MSWRLSTSATWKRNKNKTLWTKLEYWKQWDILTSSRIENRSWTRNSCALSWITQTGATCTRKLSTKRVPKSYCQKISCLIGLFKWHSQLNTFMIGKFYIVIWRLKTFSWQLKERLRLEILELLEFYNTLMIAQKQQ